MKESEHGPHHEGNRSLVLETALKDIEKSLPLRVLSKRDWMHWKTWGYVIVPDAVSQDHVEQLVDFLWDFQEMDPDDPSTWGKGDRRPHEMTELNNSGMVEVYNHQLLWTTRERPRIYDAFVDIWDREDLWVTIDRANLNPPNRTGIRQFDGFIHWDVDTSRDPLPVNVQGVLSLVDTDTEVGGFQCVPELFRRFDAWRDEQPADRDPFYPDVSQFEVRFIPLQAGDLLIWNSLLAHGIKPNRSRDRARIAQYVSMYPADESNEPLRQKRIRSWRDRVPPDGIAFPGDPRNLERTRYGTAELGDLGMRLLGAASWESGRTVPH